MASRLKDDLVINKNNENNDLLVFGYSCKLFRDDEKALFIDQGKHLIPWMGDETLKIDRYDARGTLFDLRQAEAPSGGFDRFFGLTDMEKQVESMCDEERYRALVANEEEESMYQEEELKRLHYAIGDKANTYGQVEYKYDGEANFVEENVEKPPIRMVDDGGEDEPFVPSPQLDLPLNMILPETVKHNAIIEKTAMFIYNQGPQMEILLKMKQAGNPQFNFLSYDNPLHNYYRHLLMAIKGGRYNLDLESSNKKQEMENGENSSYLHPSLASSVSKVELAPSIPSINYKPSAHCAYSMLVNKIKDKKTNEHGTHLLKLKEALERLKEEKITKNGSDGESAGSRPSVNQDSDAPTLTTPPRDMQIIIDKMASYVVKNGRDFETVVQMKNDPRFDFLNASHSFNPYYQYKIKQYEIIEKSSKPETKVKSENSGLKIKEEHSKSKLAPVCFSIKKPKDSEPVIEKSALPLEESSDEEGRDEKKNSTEEKEKDGKEEVVTIDLAAIEEKEEKNKKIMATERLKDKLTTAAREKVAMATKEKQLQLERKRRAAVFLKSINSDGKGSATCGPQLPQVMETEADGESDIASLPDIPDDSEEEKNKATRSENFKHKHSRPSDERREKRHRSSNIRHMHREKRRSKLEAPENLFLCEETIVQQEPNERVVESSLSSDEDVKRKGIYANKTLKLEDSFRTNKSSRIRTFRSAEKRHKKKKHKKDDLLDRSSRKHSKLKREKRNDNEGKCKILKSKRSRRDSTSSSDQKS